MPLKGKKLKKEIKKQQAANKIIRKSGYGATHGQARIVSAAKERAMKRIKNKYR